MAPRGNSFYYTTNRHEITILYNVQFSILDYINSEMASKARSHVEGVVMVFCSTWWLIRVCGEI